MQSMKENSRALVISNDKQVPTQAREKKVTSIDWYLQNTEEYTVEKCKNCQSFPCLDGKPVTSENFVNKAYFKGSGTMGPIHGYTYIEDFGYYVKTKWLHFSSNLFSENFNQTQTFTENVKSLKYSCHI